jgi:hypothetical protein
MFTQPMLLACLALFASLVLCARHRPLLFPVIAAVASGLEVAMAFGLVHVSVARLPMAMIYGVMLLVGGIATYVRTADKLSVTAATTVTLVGALQTLAAVHLR